VSETAEFEVGDVGQPRLDGQEGDEAQASDPVVQAQPVAVPGWTQDEAARVVGGMVAGLTTVLYLVRYQAPPGLELIPQIAGDPEKEFPLLGMSLAPILDLIAPKGSAAAVGVGLGAGLSELATAMVRRVPVLATPPAGAGRPASAVAPAAAPTAESAPDGDGFRFRGKQLEVLAKADEAPLAGLGLA
jgi:hypothetical protein